MSVKRENRGWFYKHDPHRLAKAAAKIEHIIVIVLIRSLNYIQPKDRTAQQGRSCYHLDPIVSELPFNIKSFQAS